MGVSYLVQGQTPPTLPFPLPSPDKYSPGNAVRVLCFKDDLIVQFLRNSIPSIAGDSVNAVV